VTLQVTIETAGRELVETWVITNLGHPDTGDRPDDDDLRRYRVQGPDGEFEVIHRRGDGARPLASLALLGPGIEAKYGHYRRKDSQ